MDKHGIYDVSSIEAFISNYALYIKADLRLDQVGPESRMRFCVQIKKQQGNKARRGCTGRVLGGNFQEH